MAFTVDILLFGGAMSARSAAHGPRSATLLGRFSKILALRTIAAVSIPLTVQLIAVKNGNRR